MKKFIFVSFFTLLLVFSSSAYSAEEGWYMRGSIGPALLNDSDVTALSEDNIEFDTGFFVNFAPGYDFGDFRLESEFAYQVNNVGKINKSFVKGGDVTNLSLLFNGYYDFLKGSAVRPYITAGIGIARVNAQIEADDDTDSVFAYKVGVGLSYKMSENVALDFGYRYFATSDIDVFGLKFSNSSHSILLGARYNF